MLYIIIYVIYECLAPSPLPQPEAFIKGGFSFVCILPFSVLLAVMDFLFIL